MKPTRIGLLSSVVGFSLLLAACNGGGTSSSTPPQLSNISGDYTGTMADAQAGSGPVTATLAQHGASAGGTITTTTTGGTLDVQVSVVLTASNSLAGAMVIDESNGTVCTFRTTASYDPNTNVISGSYTAVTNCTGDTGTYTLNQQCIDTVTGAARRRMGLAHC